MLLVLHSDQLQLAFTNVSVKTYLLSIINLMNSHFTSETSIDIKLPAVSNILHSTLVFLLQTVVLHRLI